MLLAPARKLIQIARSGTQVKLVSLQAPRHAQKRLVTEVSRLHNPIGHFRRLHVTAKIRPLCTGADRMQCKSRIGVYVATIDATTGVSIEMLCENGT